MLTGFQTVKSLSTIIILLAVLGLLVSLYLLSVHWGWWEAVCLDLGDCEVVNTSMYSALFGVPVAFLGALTYATLAVTAVLVRQNLYTEQAGLVQFFLSMSGLAFSVYLTAIEVFVLRTICPWCVLSAIVITLIAALSVQTWRHAIPAG